MRTMTVEEMREIEGGSFWRAFICIGGSIAVGFAGDVVLGPVGGIVAGGAAHILLCPEDAY